MDYIAPTGTPVIFLTAKATVEDRVRGLRLGAAAAEEQRQKKGAEGAEFHW